VGSQREEANVVVVSYSGKEINAKLVYYGAGLSGKTTNLESIYAAVPDTSRGKMVSMKTQSDRTLFFDLLPLDLGEIMGFKTRFLLYTVPGQVFYNATRKLVLKGADAIVFVADSEVGKMEENKESLQNLRANLAEYSLSLDDIPWVIQYNKRDLPNVYTVEELNAELNPANVPAFEAVATKGKGVFETFRGISHLLMEKVTRDLRRTPFAGGGGRGAAAGAEPQGRPAARPAAPEPAAPPARASQAPAPPARSIHQEARDSMPNPMTVDYGREISLPDDPPVAPPSRPSRMDVPAGPIEPPSFAPPALQRQPAAPAPAARMPMGAPRSVPAPAPVERELPMPGPSPAATGRPIVHPQETVVPIVLPRNMGREIVVKIVLRVEDP
jgi:signal recognition particle receptor subunit beta